MTKYYIDVHPEKCTACRICELSCSFKHHGEINPSRSRIRVNIFHDDFFFYPTVCNQCDDAWCVNICPNLALSRDPATGAVTVDANRCVGCRMCIQACPFGAMGFDKEFGISEKCDLCGGDPECVKNCFYGALEFKPLDTAVADRSRQFARKMIEPRIEEARDGA